MRLSRSLASPRSTPFGDAVLTRTQLEVLFVLAHAEDPVAPGQLAATLKVTPGAITQTVEQLRDQGLVRAVGVGPRRAGPGPATHRDRPVSGRIVRG